MKNIKEQTKDKQYNRLIAEIWNQLILWQMQYEYIKKYGHKEVLPSKKVLGKFMIQIG